MFTPSTCLSGPLVNGTLFVFRIRAFGDCFLQVLKV